MGKFPPSTNQTQKAEERSTETRDTENAIAPQQSQWWLFKRTNRSDESLGRLRRTASHQEREGKRYRSSATKTTLNEKITKDFMLINQTTWMQWKKSLRNISIKIDTRKKLENISRQTKIKYNMPRLTECNKNSTKRCGKILGNNWSPMTLEPSISVNSRIA